MTIEPIKQENTIFTDEDIKIEELKKSDKLIDKLVVLLMEPHVEDEDPVGFFYTFAKEKAELIMERFNVQER